MEWFKYDFGYEWPWTYGHLIPIALFGVLLLVAVLRKWPFWCRALLCIPILWGFVGLWIVHAGLHFNTPPSLPTDRFLQSGEGLVLDAGAGSGRSSLMVLLSRPNSQLVALDIFSSHYGIGDNTPSRLVRNAAIAGVVDRLEVKTGDMQDMPLATDTFDAALSAFAIDHLPKEGVVKAMSELHRTLKPGGELLLLVVNPDVYIRVAYPLVAEHGYFGPRDSTSRWTQELRDAGFELIETGTAPGTLYLLARAEQ